MADKKFSDFTSGSDVKIGDTAVGLRSGDNYKFDFPGSGIKDANGNYLYKYTSGSSAAINYLEFTNAATGNSPFVIAAGSDPNIPLFLKAKGLSAVDMSPAFTVNSSVEISSIINDPTMAAASATNLSSALAMKTYVNSLAGTALVITDDTTTNATMYPTWVTASSGSLPVYVSSSKMSFNPNSGLLSSTAYSGAWNGSLITGTYGGTGVNNGASTITVGGNVQFSGAFPFTGTVTAGTTITFPVTGTLASLAGTETFTNKTINGLNNTISNLPYDVAFIAGFTAGGVATNLFVQNYGFLVMARTGKFIGASGYLTTVATGSAVIVDVLKNGVTIYTTKPQFAIASNTMTAGTLKTDGTEDFVAGDRITFAVTQIGSVTPGQGLMFTSRTRV